MKNKYRILKILIIVGGLIFLLNFSLNRFNNQPLRNVSVKMIQETPVYFVDEKEVREFIKENYPDQLIGKTNVPILEKRLKENLEALDSVNVYLSLNGVLNVDIKQRIPVLRINNNGKQFYVDQKGIEFPLSNKYAHPCILISGNIPKEDYRNLIVLANKIQKDSFYNNFFAGISKTNQDYFLLTNTGNYRVGIGDLENIDFKLKGFKTFMEKYLVQQDPLKYKEISLKYNNQIVTTLNKKIQEIPETQTDTKIEVSSSKQEEL